MRALRGKPPQKLATAATLLATFGCTTSAPHRPGDSSDAGGSSVEGRTTDAGRRPAPSPPTYAPTFSALYREVIVPRGCVLGLCHAANAGGLNLESPEVGYSELVGVPSVSEDCGHLGLLLVRARMPELSLFYLKLLEIPPCGEPMAPAGALEPAALDQVKRWIELGAPE